MTHFTRRTLLAGSAAMALAPTAAFADKQAFRRLGLAEPAFDIDPALDLPDLAGVTHQLADYRGKTTLVSFWATWCPPCREGNAEPRPPEQNAGP